MRASWTLEEPKANARRWSRKLYSFHYTTPWICIGPFFGPIRKPTIAFSRIPEKRLAVSHVYSSKGGVYGTQFELNSGG